MARVTWWLRRNAELVAIAVALVGLAYVVATEPVRDRHEMGLHGPVRG